MPSADFCPAVRPPFDSLSPLRTRSRSPGVSSTAFRAQSPDLRFAPLMDMDFAVSCPLVRHSRLISDSCSSTRTFAIRFLQTPPRGGSPCVLASPSPPSGWAGDLHPKTAEHAQRTTKPLRGRTWGSGAPSEGPDLLTRGSLRKTGYGYPDRKSTRLNSSHLGISYAVFCLQKQQRKRYGGNWAKCAAANTFRPKSDTAA